MLATAAALAAGGAGEAAAVAGVLAAALAAATLAQAPLRRAAWCALALGATAAAALTPVPLQIMCAGAAGRALGRLVRGRSELVVVALGTSAVDVLAVATAGAERSLAGAPELAGALSIGFAGGVAVGVVDPLFVAFHVAAAARLGRPAAAVAVAAAGALTVVGVAALATGRTVPAVPAIAGAALAAPGAARLVRGRRIRRVARPP